MNTTELIKIAREYCFLRQAAGDETVLLTFKPGQLQQFAQRIEQPHLQRIAELEQLLAIENERAAVICTSLAPSKREFSPRFYDACYVCADAIRAAKHEEEAK